MTVISPALETYIGVRTYPAGVSHAVFRVPTTARGDVFMSIDVFCLRREHTSVVEVDAGRFLELWRQPVSSHRDVAHGTSASWARAREYSWCEQHFAIGMASPVPVPYITCRRLAQDVTATRRRLFVLEKRELVAPRGAPFVSFVNGIVNTTWLMANSAHLFPISCPTSHADLLQALVGREGRSPVELARLAQSSAT